MKGFSGSIEQLTMNNTHYRQVIYTALHAQLVLMCLKPGEDIGMETHEENDQFFRFESGQGKVMIDGNEYNVVDGTAVMVPSGAKHNVINTSDVEFLKFYSIYSPPHHKDGIVRQNKEEALAHEAAYDGTTTE